MSFSPTFGSIGDFISLSILIKDVVNAVGDAHGSVADYHSLSNELDTIVAVLQQAHLLCTSRSPNPDVQALHEIAKNAIGSCQSDLTSFTARFHKYKSTLGDGDGGLFKRSSMKVLWLTEKDDINKFRIKLVGFSASLNAILNMATVRMLEANEADRRNDATTWAEGLQVIARSVRSLSNTLLRKVGQVIWLNLFIYQDLRTRLLHLESRIERPIAEEIFTFEDAIGRRVPVSLRLVDSWETFDALLMARFKGLKGFGRVSRRRYALQDHRRQRALLHSIPWRSAMLPGSQVSMSIICSQLSGSEGEPSISTSCPSCFSMTTVATDEWSRW
ncbi:hypothetical protein PG989_013816 [Apiospora arundinis]